MHESYMNQVCEHIKNDCEDEPPVEGQETKEKKEKKKSQKQIFYMQLKNKKNKKK